MPISDPKWIPPPARACLRLDLGWRAGLGAAGQALRRFACRSALAVVALAGPAVSAHAAPRDVYELQPLRQATVLQDMHRCVGPQAGAEQLQSFLSKLLTEANDDDPTRAAQLTTPGGAGVVLAAAGQWACVALSGEGFPLWPLEAMHGFIVPVGVPAALTRAWRRNLLAQVARDGVGRGLIVYPGGEADQVHVIAEQRQAMQIKLSMRLLPAGSYREQQYPAVLRHPGLTRLVTRSSGAEAGTPWRMAIPPHRLLKPVREGFVEIEPTAQTSRFEFDGTQWLLGSEDGPVTLQADGSVARSAGETRTSTRGAKPLGHWRVVGGVLRLAMADGARYALTLRDSPHTLKGMGRRVDSDGAEDEGGELQWPAQMHRHGVQESGRAPGQQA